MYSKFVELDLDKNNSFQLVYKHLLVYNTSPLYSVNIMQGNEIKGVIPPASQLELLDVFDYEANLFASSKYNVKCNPYITFSGNSTGVIIQITNYGK